MSTAIAEILRQRIEDLAIVDKSAGLVRAIPRSVQVNGRPITRYFPVGCNVSDPDSCTIQQIEDLVPSSNYASIIYFEDLGSTRRPVNIPGASAKTVRLRLVAWMNLNKLGPLCTTGDAFQREIERTINADRYDLNPYKAMTHRVVGSPIKSNSIFAKYNYDEVNRQYLNWPYDYFAIDIETNFILQDGCEEPIVPSDSQCAPIPTRKRFPKDFSCEDLLDPVTGLTAEQLGPDCLDCGSGGVCLPVTVHNSDDSYSQSVDAGGDLALPDTAVTNTAAEPIATVPATEPYVIPDVSWTDTDGAPMTTPYGQPITCAECEPCEDGTVVVKDSAGDILYTVPVESGGTVDQQINDSYVAVKDSSGATLHTVGVKAENTASQTVSDSAIQLKDSAGTNIGAATNVKAETSANVTAPDSSAVLKDTAGATLSTTAIKSNASANITAPDGTVQPKNQGGSNLGSTFTVKSGETKNATIPIPLKFVLSTGSTSSVLFTVTTDEAGTYTTYTNDGASGTWTYSKNGGSFTSLTGTIVLATSDTIQVKRTVITAQGYSRWAP